MRSQGKGTADQESVYEQKKSVFKLYMRIWVTTVRQVRNQCEKNENRPVELKNIGLFFKRKGDSLYTFVPNDDLLNDARLRLAEINTENAPALPAEVNILVFNFEYRLLMLMMEKLSP
jgi:hypothetical protein